MKLDERPSSDSSKSSEALKTTDDPEKGLPALNGAAQSSSTTTEEKSPRCPAHAVDLDESQWKVEFSGDDDPDCPRSFRTPRKWLVTFVIAFSSFCVTCNSSLYTTTYSQLEREFKVSREVCTLGLSTFVWGLMIGPMLLAPLSEFYGRRPVYLVAYAMCFLFLIPCAVAQNIQTILIARFFDGFFASAFLSVAGGTIGDCFAKKDLSLPMMIYSGSPFLGPALGPLIGGFINQYASWRWSFWTLLIWTGVQFLVILALVPETYHPVLLRRKAQRLRKETGDEKYFAPIERMDKTLAATVLRSCYRPFQLLVLEPMCLALCLLSALLLGILYLFFGAFPLVFMENHGFTLSQTGLTFLGLCVGMLLAIFSDFFWKWNYARLVANNGGVSEPEFRLPPTIFGSVVFVIGLFGFGWTTFSFVHWIAPIIFSALFGLGVVTSFAGIFTFKVEAYPMYAASALGANSFARSAFAAAFPLFGVQMYNTLGYQWASTLLAFLGVALMPFPYIFFRYGKRIRARSRFT